MSTAHENLRQELREIGIIGTIGSLLAYDEQVFQPKAAAAKAHRADEMAFVATLHHQRATSKKLGDLISSAEDHAKPLDQHSDGAVIARNARRDYDRATKLPGDLVAEMAKTEVLAQNAWAEARKKASFSEFKPWLATWMKLKRREVDCVGYDKTSGHPYDALLDTYEPFAKTMDVRKVFDGLRGPLVELVRKIGASSKKAPVEIMSRAYDVKKQDEFGRMAAAAIGFDFGSGRLDVSVHPFCSGIAAGDTRMTTRYHEHHFNDAFFGVLHESGHALYEQGLPKSEHVGNALGESISLGIHESQSRMWENLVGRSREFWKFFLPKAKQTFGSTIADVNEEQWHFAVNAVQPSFIRVEADETTYNLHTMIRFELEQMLIDGSLGVDDVPTAWNERYKNYLGITPPDDAKGCLQDVHWSAGLCGYFSTYTLGNLYASQFFEKAQKDIGDLDGHFARGNFKPLLEWLRENIHKHGRRYTASELVKRVTGEELSAEPLMRHLRKNASELYGVN